MSKVALIETKPTGTNFEKEFDNAFTFDRYHLCSNPSIKKVLKRDVDIEINIDDYDWIILIGADVFKHFTGQNGVTSYSGRVVNDKFLPSINPSMLRYKPEATKLWEDTKISIIKYISGEVENYDATDSSRIRGIETKEE
ncbi:unnamed protein product, partial [marine sediment metagenome]